ncbi:MAG: esterase/lipase family protein [Telluria sp.]
MQGIWVNEPAGKQTAVVFVHGVLSSSESGWTHENGSSWPQLLSKALPEASVAIYTYAYNTSLDSGSYSIDNAADVLQTLFQLDGLCHFRNIIFVCHSMGGLVARRFLVRRHYEYPDIAFSFFLVASPTQGCDYANWLTPIGKLVGHAQVDALRVSQTNPWLTSLNSDFAGIVRARRITGKELVEDRSIFQTGGFFRKPIVSPLAAGGLFPDPLKIPKSDHFSISKPDGPTALQHRMLLSFVRDTMNAPAPLPVADHSDHCGQSLPPLVPPRPPVPDLAALQRLILLSSEEEKIAFIRAMAYGPGLGLAEVPHAILTSYGDALRAMQVHLLAAAASRLVIEADPAYRQQPRLIAVMAADLPPETNAVSDIVFALFQQSALKGPRMLAALLLCAPQQAVHAAGAEIGQVLRKLSGEA